MFPIKIKTFQNAVKCKISNVHWDCHYTLDCWTFKIFGGDDQQDDFPELGHKAAHFFIWLIFYNS
jgi:hypothetical protein